MFSFGRENRTDHTEKLSDNISLQSYVIALVVQYIVNLLYSFYFILSDYLHPLDYACSCIMIGEEDNSSVSIS